MAETRGRRARAAARRGCERITFYGRVRMRNVFRGEGRGGGKLRRRARAHGQERDRGRERESWRGREARHSARSAPHAPPSDAGSPPRRRPRRAAHPTPAALLEMSLRVRARRGAARGEGARGGRARERRARGERNGGGNARRPCADARDRTPTRCRPRRRTTCSMRTAMWRVCAPRVAPPRPRRHAGRGAALKRETRLMLTRARHAQCPRARARASLRRQPRRWRSPRLRRDQQPRGQPHRPQR